MDENVARGGKAIQVPTDGNDNEKQVTFCYRTQKVLEIIYLVSLKTGTNHGIENRGIG